MADATEDGRNIPALNAVGVDVLALLAGVNFNSVLKIIHSAHLIQRTTGVSLDELLSLEGLPSCPVVPGSFSGARARNTRAAVRRIVSSGVGQEHSCLHANIAKLVRSGIA